MNDEKLLRVGIVGAVVAAVCCLTPVLVVLLGALGLSAAVGWLDYVLMPLLALCVVMVGYAMIRRRKAGSE